MPEMNSAAQSRDRRRVNALANRIERAVAGIELAFYGMSERERVLALHIWMKSHGGCHAQDGIAGGDIAPATMERGGRPAAARMA